MKTLIIYNPGGGYLAPPHWLRYNLLVKNEADIGQVRDIFDNILIETINLGFHGFEGFVADEKSVDDFQTACANQVAQYILHGPIKYDLIIAGQTPESEYIIKQLDRSRITLGINGIIRFSSYYGNPNPPYDNCSSPASAGYDLDCPKDFAVLDKLLFFLGDESFGYNSSLSSLIARFNLESGAINKLGKPILELRGSIF